MAIWLTPSPSIVHVVYGWPLRGKMSDGCTRFQWPKGKYPARLSLCVGDSIGDFHKARGQLRGEGISQMTILLHKLYLVKVTTKGERGVKNIQNFDHMVYGWPPMWNINKFLPIQNLSFIRLHSFGSFKIGQFFEIMKDLNQTGHDLGNHLSITKKTLRRFLWSKGFRDHDRISIILHCFWCDWDVKIIIQSN